MSNSHGNGAPASNSFWSRLAARLGLGASAAPAIDAGEADRVSRSWEALARHDPLWAIVSTPDKRGNRWDENEFFDTGAVEVRHVFDLLARLGVAYGRGAALDFGAGVGRLTQALALRFDRVDGVDISTTMLAKARTLNRHGERVRYVQGEPDRLPLPSATYDFVLSRIVLQHLQAALQSMYLQEFMRVLKPGGIAVFQVVTGVRDASPQTVFQSPIDTGEGTVTIDMNLLPHAAVEAAVGAGGGRVLHRVTDLSAGETYESHVYVVAR